MNPVVLALCLAAAPAAGRPVLSGPELIHLSSDGLLRVHYTLEGEDAVTVPDTLAWVDEGAARMIAAFVGEDGWPPPPADEGRGGDDRLDVYLRALDANGYTYAETLSTGGVAAYIEVAPGNAGLGQEVFESIVGHEVHHVLELADAGDFEAPWIAEASATYAQYLLFDDAALTLARNFLWRLRLDNPARALDDAGHADRFEYAGMIWVKYLIDRGGGDRRILKALWDDMAAQGGWVAGHDALARDRLGLADLSAAAADFAVWNWFACDNDDGRHYDPTTVACTYGGNVKAETHAVPASGTSEAIGARGSAYVGFQPDCATGDLEVDVAPSAAMRLQLVADGQVVAVADGGETTLIAHGWNAGGDVFLVGTNLSAAPATFDWDAHAAGDYVGPAPASIALAPATVSLEPGARAALVAQARYTRCADPRDVTARAEWRSSDERVAVVAGGEVNALAPGVTEIVAVVAGVESSRVQVTVTGTPGGCSVVGPPYQTQHHGIIILILSYIGAYVVFIRHCRFFLHTSVQVGVSVPGVGPTGGMKDDEKVKFSGRSFSGRCRRLRSHG